MTMPRTFGRRVCRALIGLMLFTQLAVAAYACPALSLSGQYAEQAPVAAAHDDRPASDIAAAGETMASVGDRAMNCDQMPVQMDPASPNLCAEHCRYGQQSDQAPTATVPAAILTALYVITSMLPQVAVPPRPAAGATSALAAASPPHAILHCCYRI